MWVTVRRIEYGSEDYQAELRLRYEVLRKPLGLEFSEEELALEEGSIHFGAFEGSELLGCLVLTPLSATEVRMRQVAVAPGRRGEGIGKRLVRAAENFARQSGYEWIKLNARETAVGFYQSLAYEAYGDPFITITIPHRTMRKRLAET